MSGYQRRRFYMGLFFPQTEIRSGVRYTGFARYRQVIERDWKDFILVGFMTLLYHIPFGLGLVYAILSQSLLVMLISSLVGGLFVGPGLACMYDLILRRLRDDRSDWWICYKKSMRQNLRASVLPGVIQCLFVGCVVFSGCLLWWSESAISWGTVALIIFSSLVTEMILSVWWPQVVLFDQKPFIQIKNCILFILTNLGRILGSAALQVIWWLVTFLLLPWSAFLVPVLSVWYILLLAMFIIYQPLNEAFRIEEQIEEHFPGQMDAGED